MQYPPYNTLTDFQAVHTVATVGFVPELQFLYINTSYNCKLIYHQHAATHTGGPNLQRVAGLRTYLTEVGDGQVHACQLLPHWLCQIETKRASGPDGDAQEHSCRHVLHTH